MLCELDAKKNNNNAINIYSLNNYLEILLIVNAYVELYIHTLL